MLTQLRRDKNRIYLQGREWEVKMKPFIMIAIAIGATFVNQLVDLEAALLPKQIEI